MDGRAAELQVRGTGIGTPDGVAHLGEVRVVIGAENPMVLHQRLVVGDGVEVSAEVKTEKGKGTVTMITGGYHRPEGIVILHLPDVAHVEDGTVGEAGEGRGTRDLAVRPAETPGTIERSIQIGM